MLHRHHPEGRSLQKVVREAVAKQVLDDDPPQAWQAVERMLGLGLDAQDVMHQLVLTGTPSVIAALGEELAFGTDRYAQSLSRLPLPDAVAAREALLDRLLDDLLGDAGVDLAAFDQLGPVGAGLTRRPQSAPQVWRRTATSVSVLTWAAPGGTMTTMTVLQVPHDGWTTNDLPDTDLRYELVDGALLVTPPPHFRHSVLANELAQLLGQQPVRAGGAPPTRASASTCATTASDAPPEVMFPRGQAGVVEFSDGDKAGLAAVGRGA